MQNNLKNTQKLSYTTLRDEPLRIIFHTIVTVHLSASTFKERTSLSVRGSLRKRSTSVSGDRMAGFSFQNTNSVTGRTDCIIFSQKSLGGRDIVTVRPGRPIHPPPGDRLKPDIRCTTSDVSVSSHPGRRSQGLRSDGCSLELWRVFLHDP